jgi:pimeloyl-ACP methyl ester carboxylesterase
VADRMIQAKGIELCTESFGRPADPPILLIMGIGASMLVRRDVRRAHNIAASENHSLAAEGKLWLTCS